MTRGKNFSDKLTNPIGNLELCLQKYKEPHNIEYLCDVANYAMFEFMYPKFDDAYFKATDSNESAGITGFCIRELDKFKNENN